MWWKSIDKYNFALEKEVIWTHNKTRARVANGWKSNIELLIEEVQAVRAEFGEIIYPNPIEEQKK